MIPEIICKLIDGLEHELEKAFRTLFRLWPHHPRCRHNKEVRQVFIRFFNNQKYIIMEPVKIRLDKNFHILAVLVHASTNLPVDGATKVLKSRTSSDETIVKIDANGDAIPVAKGAAQITEVNSWTYKNEFGEDQTSDQTTTLDIQVVDGPDGVLQVVTLVQFDPAPPADPTPDPLPEGDGSITA